jgi:2-keto-myo-inositol isomerase
MKLAYHGATSMKSDLATDVAVSDRAGYGALEVWTAKTDSYLVDHTVADMANLFARHRVSPTALNSIEFIAFRGEEYKHIRERCLHLCQLAERIGCGVLVVVPSPTPQAAAGTVFDLFYPWEKIVEEYVTVLRDLSEIARPYGVKLAFEFLGFAWCSVRTPRGAYEIIQEVARDNVGLNFDACHFYGGGGEMSEIDLLDPTRICTFHINDMEPIAKEAIQDSKRLLPGLGAIPLKAICAHLKGIGYDGLCAVELFRPEYWEWDPYGLAVKARQAAIEVLDPYFDIV